MPEDMKKTGYDTQSVSTENLVRTISLPGHPRIQTQAEVDDFMVSDLCTPELDRLSPWLWLISTPSHSNITPLHAQKLRGREVIVMEDPGLHLVWRRGAVYIKPIPKYLLDQEFRQRILSPKEPYNEQMEVVRAAARGYLRTYAFLIRYESDFMMAQSDELRLVPKSMDWTSFNNFISEFEELEPASVNPRFQSFGELRFSRVTLLGKLWLHQWHYRYTHATYNSYLENFYAPLLFVFATVSVVLNAMQVMIAAGQLDSEEQWRQFLSAARGFALFTMVVTATLCAGLMLLLTRKLAAEAIFAISLRVRGRAGRKAEQTTMAAMIDRRSE